MGKKRLSCKVCNHFRTFEGFRIKGEGICVEKVGMPIAIVDVEYADVCEYFVLNPDNWPRSKKAIFNNKSKSYSTCINIRSNGDQMSEDINVQEKIQKN